MISTGPKPSQRCATNATARRGRARSRANPPVPAAARAAPRATPGAGCTSTNGLDARNAATASPTPTASRRHCFQPATTSGTSRKTPGILETRREADGDACELDPPSHHQRQRHGHAERQRDVGDRLARVRDLDRADRDGRGRDTRPPLPYALRPSHQAAAIAPSARTTATIRAVRYDGSSCHDWNGAFDVHEQRRIVEPVRISSATVHQLPRARHDRLLVRVEEVAERQSVLDPDEAQRSSAGEDRGEGGGRARPSACRLQRWRPARPAAGRRRRARRRFVLRR